MAFYRRSRGRLTALGWMLSFTLALAALGSATPGLDAPAAVGAYLNGHLPNAEPTGQFTWSLQETYTGININLPMHLCPYPGTNKLLCVAKEGRIFLFDDNASATIADTFLDIRSKVFTNSDAAVTWLAFHPQFGVAGNPNNAYVYITYKWNPTASGYIAGDGMQAYWRLSRFTVIQQNGKPVADPASEQILIQQYDRNYWHDSGCLAFGPDGYLYIGTGDEGGANDQYNDGQKINDRLFSGILRIDVDQKATNHAIRRQPQQLTMPAGWPNSYTQNYKIPEDNPFNNVSGSVLEEFYALGLRNPYRFSYDSVSNRWWIGDVGQDTREEVDILTAGGNYGWPYMEGSAVRTTGTTPVLPNPIIGNVMIPPVWDSPHGTDGCVVGGFVYRGSANPTLVGKFISVDNVNSHVRAHTLNANGTTATNEILADMPSGSVYSGTSTIGRDAAGEPIFVKINGTGTRGRYFKLVGALTTAQPPSLLSQTGAFTDLATLTPAAGVVPYTVNAPLWSDGAVKRRWMALPNDGTHNTAAEKIAFAPEGNWTFPAGTVFIKHFELPVNDGDPSVLKRIETRFVIIPASGEPYGLTYKWRSDDSDADLLPGGLSETIDITTTPGGTRQQTWEYPSRSDCRVCHNGNANYVLGVKTQQLNGNFTYPLTGRTANQLETLGALGWFDSNYHADLLPWMLQSRHVADNAASLTDRARSYIDSNCSQCHRPGGVRADFDARYTTPLEEQGVINGSVESNFGDTANKVVVPGSPEHSVMLMRVGSLDSIKMPPLAKHVVDPSAVSLLTEWINSLGTGPSVTLAIGSAPTGPFTLNVHFTQPVTGLELGDFQISGGTATGLTGSGADYVLSVTPASFGAVTVKLPANRVINGGSAGNYASETFAVEITDPNLVAWLKLDDAGGTTASDSSSYGNHTGDLIATTSANWVAGKMNGALALTAGTQYVKMSNYLGSDFSISFWMKSTQAFPVTTNGAQGSVLFNADVSGPANDFVIAGTRGTAAGPNRITFQTGAAAGNIAINGATAVNDGQWKHIAVTRVKASGAVKLYVNGVLDASGTGTTGVLTASSFLYLGAVPGNTAYSYLGAFDDVRLFTTALSDSDVATLAAGPPPTPPYDLWKELWMPGLYHLQSADVDAEGDGRTNFGEYAFGGNPLAPDVIPTPLQRAADGTLTIGYRTHKAPSGVTYRILMSSDLKNWSDATSQITGSTTTPIPDSDYQWTDVICQPPPGPDWYFRVEAKP